MDQLNRKDDSVGTNVTLDATTAGLAFAGTSFPCCLCRSALPLKPTKRGKPCCTCNDCGIQIFFRGKTGIARLTQILNSGNLEFGNGFHKMRAVICFMEIEQLRKQKKDLADKTGLIFHDKDLTNAIRAVDNEIKRKQIELAKLGRASRVTGAK